MEVPGLATTSAQPWDLAQGRTGPALRRHIPRGRCPQPRGAAQSSRRHRGSAGTWCRSSRRGRGAPPRRRGARPRRTAPKVDREPEQRDGSPCDGIPPDQQRKLPRWSVARRGLRKSGPTEVSLPEWTRSKRLGNGTETPAWLRNSVAPCSTTLMPCLDRPGISPGSRPPGHPACD